MRSLRNEESKMHLNKDNRESSPAAAPRFAASLAAGIWNVTWINPPSSDLNHSSSINNPRYL